MGKEKERKGGLLTGVAFFFVFVVLGLVVMEFTGVTDLRSTAPNIVQNFQNSIPETSKSDGEGSISITEDFAQVPPSPMPEGYWPEIHSKHFLHGYPIGTPHTNDLIIRDIYAMSNNDDSKFADWVAYRLDEKSITGESVRDRKWAPDPWLEEDETLEPDDYKDANVELKTDRGHQAPLASFKGTETWHETNYLSNITPQKANLNQGPWVQLEGAVRGLVEKRGNDPVYVMTGPYYGSETMELPEADEYHIVPSGYWKIISVTNGDGDIDHSVAFLFEQETPRSSDYIDHLVTIREIELRTGLNFFSALEDDEEDKLESKIEESWAKRNLK